MDFSKMVFYATSAATLVAASVTFGLYHGSRETVVRELARDAKRAVDSVVADASTRTGIRPKYFLQPARDHREGVTVNEAPASEMVLLAGFFGDTNEIRLVKRDGTIVARWPVKFSELFPNPDHLWDPPVTDWNIDLHGTAALPDGSVLFNFDYGGLVKLNRCGETEWTLNRATHHSVESAESGGFWVPGRRRMTGASQLPPFETPFVEDTVMRVSETGEVLAEFSVPQLFYENDLGALLTSTGHAFTPNTAIDWDLEIVHLNKVGELSTELASKFPMFDSGDLVLSLRNFNLIMVVNPSTRRIKWWKIGPWLRQHDPEFMPNGKLAIFNNNTFQTAAKGAGASNIVEVDPQTGTVDILYDNAMYTMIRGKINPTTSGMIVTEPDGGRAFEVDRAGTVIWEYVNRFDSKSVAQITEARVYPEDYFSVSDWTC